MVEQDSDIEHGCCMAESGRRSGHTSLHKLGKKSSDMRNRVNGSGSDVPGTWNDRRRRLCKPDSNIDGNADIYGDEHGNKHRNGHADGIAIRIAKLRSDGKLHRPCSSDT